MSKILVHSHCKILYLNILFLKWDSLVKNPPTMQDTWVQSLGLEDPLEEGMATHSSILAETPHGQSSQAGYSPWGDKASDMTERLSTYLKYDQVQCAGRSQMPEQR